MRILMISDVYFPRINGVSTSIQTFRRGLHAAGHETILIAPEYPGAAPDTEPDILRVPSRGVPRDPEDRAMKLGAIRALRPQLEKLEPDLVHIQTPFIAHYQGTALARALRVPVIETYHTYFEEYLHHYVPLLPRAVMRFVARRFTVSQCNVLDSLVVPSRAMEQALLDYGVQCPMHIIPTGMEMERFAGGDGQRFRAQLGIAPGQPVLVHVGRIAHEKNIDFLFRMFAIVVRRKPGAVLHDIKEIADRVVRMVQDGAVVSVTGKVIKMRTDTVCIHGDTPGAVEIGRGVRQALKDAGIDVMPFKVN